MINYDNSILLSFMGMHNTLHFDLIKQNFGVDYTTAVSAEQCFQETVGMFKESSDILIDQAEFLANDPNSFKDDESKQQSTMTLLSQIASLSRLVLLQEKVMGHFNGFESPLDVNPL